MKNNLAVVILTWNDYSSTIDCLKSILNQDYKNYKIFLIDNNSEDKIFFKILKWLGNNHKKKFYDKIIDPKKKISNVLKSKYKIFFTRNKKNLGCGYGHNTGYKIAIKNNFKFVARIDNDMIMPKKFFSKIIKNFNDNNVQAVSPKILYKESKNRIWWMGTTIGNNLKFQRHLRDYKYGMKDKTFKIKKINSDAIAGCASIMRVKRLKKVGLSDKDFFYGPEDIELSRRLSMNKNSLLVDLDTKIYHGVSRSFREIPIRRIYYEYKYRLLLVKKIGTFADKLFGYMVAIIKLFGYLVFSFNTKHRKKIKPIFFGLLHFFTNKLGDFDRKQKFRID